MNVWTHVRYRAHSPLELRCCAGCFASSGDAIVTGRGPKIISDGLLLPSFRASKHLTCWWGTSGMSMGDGTRDTLLCFSMQFVGDSRGDVHPRLFASFAAPRAILRGHCFHRWRHICVRCMFAMYRCMCWRAVCICALLAHMHACMYPAYVCVSIAYFDADADVDACVYARVCA